MLLFLTTLCVVVILPICDAGQTELACDVILQGCGSFESTDGTDNTCCVCRECLSVDCLIPVDVHCL